MKRMRGTAALPFVVIGALFHAEVDAFVSSWILHTRMKTMTCDDVLSGLCHKQPMPSQRTTQLLMSTITDPAEMKLRDIKDELREMGVSYADCFDRESLVSRLTEARNGETATTKATDSGSTENPSKTTDTKKEPSSSTPNDIPEHEEASTKTAPKKEFDRNAAFSELRSLRVSELRSRLASRQIRWANMIEKEDLVQALVSAMEKSSQFSLSGALTPGEATDITGDILTAELSGDAGTPLLLDVYATWCGPCKMMAPQMNMAAQEMGETCRVAKIDSDRNQEWAAKLRIEGLPTVIVFDQNGKEVGRREGLLMKSNLVDFVKRNTGI
uniref:Thioredoxin domain-containing protein n=1 Tax=Ditylum brightwellii TaxID=49249 RepID=A0A7S4T607_9STRA